MNTPQLRFKEWLAVTGYVGLAMLAIPVFAILVFVLRAALLAAVVGGLAVAVTLWLCSARFRAWLGAWAEPEVMYKGLRLATDVGMHPGHAWARMDGGQIMVGADDVLPAVLGPVESVDLPPAGRHVVRGDVLFRLRRGDRAVEVPAPVSGTVVGSNEDLAREPGLVNADPFQRGWAVMLSGVPGLGFERHTLRRGQDARAWFRAEVDRLLATVLAEPAAAPAMADGGLVTGDLYRRIDDETWRQITATLGGARS
jgi:glycine cleavage system H lipoate-binding protein